MRGPLIDNAKGVLIFLVVLGHFLEVIDGWGNRYLSAILSTIYLFHMPAFVFLAGMTAKRERLGVRVANIAIVLVMFQLAYVIPVSIIDGKSPVGLLQPYWIIWFLLSLIWWTLLIPLIVRLPYAFAMSIGVAIVGGFYPGDGYQLSIMRTLTFLPFFVGGNLYGSRIIAASRAYSTRWYLAVAVLGAAAIVVYSSGLQRGWLYGSFTYARLGFDDPSGAMIRAALFILSSTSLVAFLACMTTKRSHLTLIGQNSLAVFVLHGFPVIIADEVIARTGQLSVPWSFVFVVLASTITTLVLAHPFFSTTIRAFADNISSCLLRDTRRTGSLRGFSKWREKIFPSHK